ncbi:chorismate mutase [Kitasatospora viridis]|uniref:Chorismate mutase n=1 Tax=Kitasatospora viridis TaxID=281105 RepID=A0A561TSX7_9ACTN|nr:chorismate mutase [Kitasatospora viridis]TWF90211.1 chorismate mutase [Kitasatospora viridis]
MNTNGSAASLGTSADDRIQNERATIDALDDQIIESIKRRALISRKIQQVRAEEGGPRLVLSREMSVLEHYRTGLGPVGTDVAARILDLCRGALHAAFEVPAQPAPAAEGERRGT